MKLQDKEQDLYNKVNSFLDQFETSELLKMKNDLQEYFMTFGYDEFFIQKQKNYLSACEAHLKKPQT
jgi:hypothetical protein